MESSIGVKRNAAAEVDDGVVGVKGWPRSHGERRISKSSSAGSPVTADVRCAAVVADQRRGTKIRGGPLLPFERADMRRECGDVDTGRLGQTRSR